MFLQQNKTKTGLSQIYHVAKCYLGNDRVSELVSVSNRVSEWVNEVVS